MKNIYYVLPLAAALLMFLGIPAQMSFAAEGRAPSNTGKTKVEKAKPVSGNKKILIAYFSHSGNTREIAEQIQKLAGGDIFEIQSVNPYPKDYDTCVNQARKELEYGYKPALKTKLNDIKPYDTVFIGYPIWWGTYPAPVRVFLSEYDLSGKTIVPFCTHEGSGLGKSVSDISKLCPKSPLRDGLAIRGSTVKTAQNQVSEWLRKNKISK